MNHREVNVNRKNYIRLGKKSFTNIYKGNHKVRSAIYLTNQQKKNYYEQDFPKFFESMIYRNEFYGLGTPDSTSAACYPFICRRTIESYYINDDGEKEYIIDPFQPNYQYTFSNMTPFLGYEYEKPGHNYFVVGGNSCPASNKSYQDSDTQTYQTAYGGNHQSLGIMTKSFDDTFGLNQTIMCNIGNGCIKCTPWASTNTRYNYQEDYYLFLGTHFKLHPKFLSNDFTLCIAVNSPVKASTSVYRGYLLRFLFDDTELWIKQTTSGSYTTGDNAYNEGRYFDYVSVGNPNSSSIYPIFYTNITDGAHCKWISSSDAYTTNYSHMITISKCDNTISVYYDNLFISQLTLKNNETYSYGNINYVTENGVASNNSRFYSIYACINYIYAFNQSLSHTDIKHLNQIKLTNADTHKHIPYDIQIEHNFSVYEYIGDCELDFSGIIVWLYYNDGHKEDVSDKVQFSVEKDYVVNGKGDKIIKVTYDDGDFKTYKTFVITYKNQRDPIIVTQLNNEKLPTKDIRSFNNHKSASLFLKSNPNKLYDVTILDSANLPFTVDRDISAMTVTTARNWCVAGAFSDCISLYSFKFNEGFATDYCGGSFYGTFKDCINLVKVIYPSTYTGLSSKLSNGTYTYRLTNGTFTHCKSLQNVTLPDTLTTVQLSDFSGTQIITLGIRSGYWCAGTTVGGIYSNAYDLYGIEKSSNIIVEEGITNIASDAFVGNDSLITLTLPSTLKRISGSGIVTDCPNLTEINISSGIEYINKQAFTGFTGTINIDKSEQELSDAPWGATDATINWN